MQGRISRGQIFKIFLPSMQEYSYVAMLSMFRSLLKQGQHSAETPTSYSHLATIVIHTTHESPV